MRTRHWLPVMAWALLGCGARSGFELGAWLSERPAGTGGTEDTGTAGVTGSGGQAAGGAGGEAGAAGVVMPLPCPTTPPPIGLPCPSMHQVCIVPGSGWSGPCGDASPAQSIVTRCESEGWQLLAGCTTQPGCPTTPPAEGSACESAGLSCFYPTAGCEAEGVVQCSGFFWRRLNACERTLPSLCSLLPHLTDEQQRMLQPGLEAFAGPAVAAWGTHLFVMGAVRYGDASPGIVGAAFIDGPGVGGLPGTISDLGFTTATPVVTRAQGRLFFSYTEPGKGTQMGRYEQGFPRVTVGDLTTTPEALVMGAKGGWLGVRRAAAKGAGHASLVHLDATLHPTGAPVPVASEEPTSELTGPVPRALVRATQGPHGMVLAAPTGDLTGGSLAVWFPAPEATTLPVPVVIGGGAPSEVSLAQLRDGTTLVAWWPPVTPGDGESFSLFAIDTAGQVTRLPGPHISGSLRPGQGPLVSAFDEGFVATWFSTVPGEPTALHAEVRGPQGQIKSSTLVYEQPAVGPTDTLVMAVSDADRALHVAWTTSPADGLRQLRRQRMVCLD